MIDQNHYIYDKDYDKEITLQNSCLRYFSKRAMKQRYPKGGFVVLGGIGCDTKEKKGSFQYKEKNISYYTVHRNRFFYGVKGYLSFGQNQYIAIEKITVLRNTVILITSLALLLGLVYTILISFPKSDIDQNAKDYTPPTGMEIKTDPNHIALPGYGTIQMNANSDTAYLALWNPPDNPCYFKFRIILAENGKLLYESELVPPGKAVTTVKMKQTFVKGSYDVDINISAFSLKDKNKEMNGGSINATIVAME